MQNKREIGEAGEALAARHLKRRGYVIVERNYFSPFGEIDIIARHDEYYVFIEVKQRKNRLFGGAAGAITPRKINKIKTTAEMYLQQHAITSAVRFDVVLIHGEQNGKKTIEVITNAF